MLREVRNNVRIVRKTQTALRALFPTVRGEILAATLTQPDKWWYLSELAQFLRTTPSSLQRDLKALVDVGILQQRRESTRAYFKADTRSPLFTDLRGLVEKTAGLLPTLQRLLEQCDTGVDVAFVYGSIARGKEHATSDVDLRANFIDDRCQVVRLFLRRKAFAFVEVQLLLTAPAPLFRFRDRCDELCPPPSVEQVSGGLTRFVELPMLMRVLVRRVDDGPVEERVGHSLWF